MFITIKICVKWQLLEQFWVCIPVIIGGGEEELTISRKYINYNEEDIFGEVWPIKDMN